MRMLVQGTLATALALLLLAVPPSAQAQRTGTMPVVGVLITFHATPSHLEPLGPELPRNLSVPALRLGLRGLGYVEGHTIALEFRFAEGRPEVLPGLAAESCTAPWTCSLPSVSLPSARRAEAAGTIPVMAVDLESDPVQRGWVRSFARPGGAARGSSWTCPA